MGEHTPMAARAQHQEGDEAQDGEAEEGERVPWEVEDESESVIALWLYAIDVPPAQPNMVMRHICDRGERLAQVWAPSRALTSEVLAHLDSRLCRWTQCLRESSCQGSYRIPRPKLVFKKTLHLGKFALSSLLDGNG